MGLSTMGTPNIISSLMLKSTGTSAILESPRTFLRLSHRKMATTRQSSVPQPPKSTKVSKKVLVAISVGACPAASRTRFTSMPARKTSCATPSSTLLPWMPKNHIRCISRMKSSPLPSPRPIRRKSPSNQPENATE